LQDAEAALARERLLEVLDGLPFIQHHAKAVALRAAAETSRERTIWRDSVVPALDRFDAATQHAGARELVGAIKELARALGVTLRFERDEEILQALADPAIPLSITARGSSRRARPSDELVEKLLGSRTRPPDGLDADVVLAQTRSRREFAERAQAGVQVFRPGAYGAAYDHHGLLLGDGTIVHFSGEAGRTRTQEALVRRVPFDAFVGLADSASLRSTRPCSVRSRDVVPLRASVASLRALRVVGSAGYQFLRNNCEHLATWALLGAAHSSQTRVAGQLARWAEKAPELMSLAQDLAGDDIAFERTPLGPASSSGGDDPIWFDLGRAYWSRDADDLIAWLPLWRHGPALAAADHPWRAHALDGALTALSWSPTVPAVLLEQGWHAALVGVVSGARDASPGHEELFWVLPNGQWLAVPATFEQIVEPRLTHAAKLIDALGASLLETLSDVYATVRRDGVEDV
jgi:hypothetical protein